MSAYDFKTLSSLEFEDLTRDLLQEELQITLESFASGRDQGVDFRHARALGGTLIVQCKHYVGSTFADLKYKVRVEELPKIRTLNPTRYILVTSLPLSKREKDVLYALLKPFVQGTGDILGQRDINNLLGRFEGVERRHFKLWLASTTVMERIFQSAIYNNSESFRQRIESRRRLYVQNCAFAAAAKILDDHRYCVITGVPGIGKTTLAEMLVVKHIKEGYDAFKIERHIDEVHGVSREGEYQLFYYDDFLGQTSLEHKLGKNEDNALIDFIYRVQRSKTHRMILTTREYILNKAQMVYEPLQRMNVAPAKCIIDLSNYTRSDKARVLFNHLYFSPISERHKQSLLTNGDYLRIIDHPHYNPRLIEYMTDMVRVMAVPSDGYVEWCAKLLDNPTEIWDHAVAHQISFASQCLLAVLTTMPRTVRLRDVEASWFSYYTQSSRRFNNTMDPNGFHKAVKELDGTFIRTTEKDKSITAEYHNPSIRDFMEVRMKASPSQIADLCEAACFFEQLVGIWNAFWQPQQHVGDSSSVASVAPQFWEGLLRTFTTRGCDLEMYTKACNPALEPRVAFTISSACVFGDPDGRGVALAMLGSLVTSLAEREGTGDELMDLMRTITRLKFDCGDLREMLLSEAKNYLFRELENYETEFRRLENMVAFLKMFPEVVAPEEHAIIREKCRDELRNEVQVVEDNYEAYDIQRAMDSVSAIGNGLGFGVDSYMEDLDHALERQAEANTGKEQGRPLTTSELEEMLGKTSKDVSDAAIAEMFGALLT